MKDYKEERKYWYSQVNWHGSLENKADFDDICNNEAEESCSEGDLLYLSKELYPLFSKDDFVYSTIGTSLEYEYNYYNKRGVSMSGMYLIDNSNKSNRSYYLFDF